MMTIGLLLCFFAPIVALLRFRPASIGVRASAWLMVGGAVLGAYILLMHWVLSDASVIDLVTLRVFPAEIYLAMLWVFAIGIVVGGGICLLLSALSQGNKRAS